MGELQYRSNVSYDRVERNVSRETILVLRETILVQRETTLVSQETRTENDKRFSRVHRKYYHFCVNGCSQEGLSCVENIIEPTCVMSLIFYLEISIRDV